MDFHTIDEILDFAIGRENEAIQLYKDLAGKVEKPELRKALIGFIKEEQEHRIKLEDVKAGGIVLSDEEMGSLDIADDIEGGEVRPDMSYADILVFAMKKENTSVQLYTDLAKAVQDEKLRDMFMWLAQEEAEHKLRFEMEYELTTF